MQERLKELRAALHLNQRDMSEKINVGQSTYAMFETGQRALKDIHIASICQAFNVNETWLRTGEGDMFIASDSSIIAQLVQQYSLKPIEQKMLEAYVALPAQYREGVLRYVEALVASVTGASVNEKTIEEQADEEAAAYRQEWLEERRAQTLLASEDGNANTAG